MKKKLILLITMMLFLTACGHADTTNNEKTVITMWHYYNGNTKDMLDAQVQEFNETVGKEKNILVDAYSYSSVNDLATAVIASANEEIGAEPMPDIFGSYADTALMLDEMELVAPLDAYFTEEELGKYRDDFLMEGRFDEEESLKIVPVAKSTEVTYINNTDFDTFVQATGADVTLMETWQGVAELSKSYYEWSGGKALFGIDALANFMFISARQLGDEFFEVEADSVNFGLSKANSKAIWESLYVPYINGYYASYGKFRSDDIKSGDLLAYSGSTASTYYFPTEVTTSKDESYEIECITVPYPRYEQGEKIAVQQGAGMVVTKSDSKREAAAVEFLKWFTAPEQNIEFAVSTGYIPVEEEALDYDRILAATDEQLEGEVAAGKNKEEVVATLTTDEKFNEWYAQLESTINGALGN